MDPFVYATIQQIHDAMVTRVLGLDRPVSDPLVALRHFLMTLETNTPIELQVMPGSLCVRQDTQVWHHNVLDPIQIKSLGQTSRIKLLDVLRSLQLPGVSDYVLTPPANGSIRSVVFKITPGRAQLRAQVNVSAV